MGGFMHLQSRPDFIGLERMGNVYFVVFQAQNGPPDGAEKRNPPFFPRPGASGTGFAGKRQYPPAYPMKIFPDIQ